MTRLGWETDMRTGEKMVIKLSANGFSDEKHLMLWERIAGEYRNLGYYCPRFIRALDGTFPTATYNLNFQNNYNQRGDA